MKQANQHIGILIVDLCRNIEGVGSVLVFFTTNSMLKMLAR